MRLARLQVTHTAYNVDRHGVEFADGLVGRELGRYDRRLEWQFGG